MEELHLYIKIHTLSGQGMGDKPLHRVTLLPLPFLCRYNKLLEEVASSLKDLLKALKGLVVMSSRLELMASSLYNNSVPEIWNAKVLCPSQPSCLPELTQTREMGYQLLLDWAVSHGAGSWSSSMEMSPA